MTNINPLHPCYIDLHLHLDGSLSLPTVRHLAKMQGVPVPEDDETLREMLSLTPQCSSLDDYLARFDFACSLLHTSEALTIATRDLLTRLKQQGVIYAEIRFAPQKSCEQGLTQRDAIEAVLKGMREVEMDCGLLISLMRGEDNREANLETVTLAEEYLGRGVVGIDLAGAETLFPTENYEYAFVLAHKKHIPFTIHAGEGRGAESVRKAIEMGATRIGHGVRALENEEVTKLLIEKGITLELCPTSNLDTKMFPSYASYPLRRLMQAGVKVTLNTDNMTVSDIDMKKEWSNMCEAFELTRAEIRQILLNSVEAAFAPETTKEKLRQQIWSAYPRVYIMDNIEEISAESIEEMMHELPSWRKEKALQFKHEQGRKECVLSFRLLQKALKEEFGINDDIEFDYGEHEKPSLKYHPDIHFNLSHCRKAVACVVDEKPVGIDIEMRGRYRESLAQHVLSDEEMAEVMTAEDKDLIFTRLWTQKEALMKLTGRGVSIDLKPILMLAEDKKITTTECDGYVYSIAY